MKGLLTNCVKRSPISLQVVIPYKGIEPGFKMYELTE